MADILIRPGQLRGDVIPPPSKSDAHRALIAASLAGAPGSVAGLPDPVSDDIGATQRCLAALMAGENRLDCHESGTTLRLLIPVAAALNDPGRSLEFDGSGRLPQRPLGEYKPMLGGHGIDLDFPEDAYLPLRMRGRLTPGVFQVPGHISSQYLSGLLFALPLLAGDSEIRLTSALESAPYVEMTLRTLRAFGVAARATPAGYIVPGGQRYQPSPYLVEKDYSQAAFWLTAAFAGSRLSVSGLSDSSAQGDRAIIGLLADFKSVRRSYLIDASQIPDLVPILAVAAALTPAETLITKAARLRLKESDRLLATEQALSAIGVRISQTDDGLIIQGGHPLEGGEADSWADHRIAMALAIAALSTRKGVLIRRAEAVRKSYPEFFREFKRLGGDIDGLNLG